MGSVRAWPLSPVGACSPRVGPKAASACPPKDQMTEPSGDNAQPPRLGRLKRRPEFLAAARGRKAGGRSLGLQARRRRRNEIGVDMASRELRLGFTCSKKVGNAVERNRARRRLKAAAMMVAPELGAPGCDYVLIGRRATIDYPFGQLCEDMRRAFRSVADKL